MPDDNPVLSRPYGPADLAGALEASNVARTVLVQAAPSVEETEYLLGIADATPHVAAVVGWIDFETPGDLAVLKRLAGHPKFVGVRPMVQDIADDDWLLRDDIQWAFRALVDLDLTFDALGFPHHIERFGTILRRYPTMRVALDHCLKPRIADHSQASFAEWADGMARLATDTQAICKLSGLVTEAGASWNAEQLRPYVDHVVEVFGASRVMWGSDWPVCRLRCEYEDWFALAQSLTAHLSESDRSHIFGGTAAGFYRISPIA